jgi:amidase
LLNSSWVHKRCSLLRLELTAIRRQTNCLTEIFFDRAVMRAQELDEYLKRTGKPVGPLHGLPISLKDQFDIVGIDSTMGMSTICVSRKPRRASC